MKSDKRIEDILNRKKYPIKFTIEIQNYGDMKNLYYLQNYKSKIYNKEPTLKDTVQTLFIKALRDQNNW